MFQLLTSKEWRDRLVLKVFDQVLISIMRKLSKNLPEPRNISKNKGAPLVSLLKKDQSSFKILNDATTQCQKRKKTVTFAPTPTSIVVPVARMSSKLEPGNHHPPKPQKMEHNQSERDEMFSRLSEMKINLQQSNPKHFKKAEKANTVSKNKIKQALKRGNKHNSNIEQNFNNLLQMHKNLSHHTKAKDIDKHTKIIYDSYNKLKQIKAKQESAKKQMTCYRNQKGFLKDKLENIKMENLNLQFQFQNMDKELQEKGKRQVDIVNQLEDKIRKQEKEQGELVETHIKLLEGYVDMNSYATTKNQFVEKYNKIKEMCSKNAELYSHNRALKDQLFLNTEKNYGLVDDYLRVNCPDQYQDICHHSHHLQSQDSIIATVFANISEYNDIINFIQNMKKSNQLNEAQTKFLKKLDEENAGLEEDMENKEQTKFILEQRFNNVRYAQQREENKHKSDIMEIKKETQRIKGLVIEKQKEIVELQQEVEEVRDFGGKVEDLEGQGVVVEADNQKGFKAHLQIFKKFADRVESQKRYCAHCTLVIDDNISYCKECVRLVHAPCEATCTNQLSHKK